MSYSNKEIESKVKDAISNATPNVLEAVLSKCEGKKDEGAKMNIITNKKTFIPKILAVAATFLLIACGSIGYIGHQNNISVDSVIGFDVNPSIELKVNKSEKVLEAKALNDDAIKILGNMDFKGISLDVAVNALIGSMLEQGYITELQNSILVTVNSKDSAKGVILEKKLAGEIDELLKAKSVNGAILAQTAQNDEALQKLATDNNISLGKAKLINEIMSKDSSLNFAELAKLSINDLNLLANSKQITLGDNVSTGEASSKSYIGNDKAKDIALKHSKIANAKNVLVALDCEDGKMLYEVEFDDGKIKYDYDLDAVTGAIVKIEKDDFANDNKEQEQDKQDEEQDKQDIEKDKNEALTEDKDDNSDSTEKETTEKKPDVKISETKANQLALTHAGIAKEKAQDFKNEIANHNNKYFYEIHFISEQTQYEYKIDANTGAIIENDKSPIETDIVEKD
ncbi:MAG: PepSY domain-containing protein [Oscillospiraceae bacterium]